MARWSGRYRRSRRRGDVDDQGAVLPGVTVSLTGPALMGSQTVVTNEHGLFRFPAVPSGTYKVTFELPGFWASASFSSSPMVIT